MKKIKVLALVTMMSVFGLMAMGSGSSDSSSTESVKIEANDSEEKEDASSETETEKANEGEVSYEITDTSFDYYTNSIGSIEYYGYVEITNTGNCNLYLDDCVFDLEDNDGHLLSSYDMISTCPSVVKPGEKGYFYNGLGSNIIDEGVSLDNGVNLVPQITVEKAKGESKVFEVTDVDLREGSYGYPKVTGRIINDSDEDEGYMYVNVIFYDENGKVLAITGTSVTDVKVGNKTSFEASCMYMNDSATMDTIKDYKVVAEATYYQF